MPHPLAAILDRAADGQFPPADGATDVLPPGDDGTIAVVTFTGHAFVLADVDPADVASWQSDDAGGGFGGALAPCLLQWLAGPDREIGSIDVVLVAPGGVGASALKRRDDQLDHGRVRRALSHRRDVEVFGNDDGLARRRPPPHRRRARPGSVRRVVLGAGGRREHEVVAGIPRERFRAGGQRGADRRGQRRGRVGSALMDVTCPRCGNQSEVRFYGPCDDCRTTLREQFQTEGRVIQLAEYEPKMNVTPNAVATKDD